MGQQDRILEQLRKQKEHEVAVKRNEFQAEVSFLEAYFGLRFVGVLKFSKRSIQPRLELEKIPARRLAVGRKNLLGVDAEHLKKIGYQKAIVPTKPSLGERLLWFAPALKKRQFMRRYMDAIARHGLIYYTFVGEQAGELVVAVDVREASQEEIKMIQRQLREKEQSGIIREQASERPTDSESVKS